MECDHLCSSESNFAREMVNERVLTELSARVLDEPRNELDMKST